MYRDRVKSLTCSCWPAALTGASSNKRCSKGTGSGARRGDWYRDGGGCFTKLMADSLKA